MHSSTSILRHEPPAPWIGRGPSPPRRRITRKLAEWISLGISIAIVGGLAAILLRDAINSNGPYAVPTVHVVNSDIQQQGAVWIVPVEVENNASQTLRDVDIELSYRRAGEQPETDTLTIDYLGRECSETIYFYLHQDPKGLKLEVRPLHYRMK